MIRLRAAEQLLKRSGLKRVAIVKKKYIYKKWREEGEEEEKINRFDERQERI